MVLEACPEIRDCGPNGAIESWRDLMSAAVVVRSMFGVSPSAYQEACEVLGPENAAAVGVHPRKGTADQLGRRLFARPDTEGGTRGVFIGPDAGGVDVGKRGAKENSCLSAAFAIERL